MPSSDCCEPDEGETDAEGPERQPNCCPLEQAPTLDVSTPRGAAAGPGEEQPTPEDGRPGPSLRPSRRPAPRKLSTESSARSLAQLQTQQVRGVTLNEKEAEKQPSLGRSPRNAEANTPRRRRKAAAHARSARLRAELRLKARALGARGEARPLRTVSSFTAAEKRKGGQGYVLRWL